MNSIHHMKIVFMTKGWFIHSIKTLCSIYLTSCKRFEMLYMDKRKWLPIDIGAPNGVSFLLGNYLPSWDSICDVSIQGNNF
jgi:hypothetical protein